VRYGSQDTYIPFSGLEGIHIYTYDSVYLLVPLMFVIGTIMTSLALTSLWYSSLDEDNVIKSLN